MSKTQNNNLVAAIVFASIVLSGSVVFFALQLSGNGGLTEKEISLRVEEGIEEYQFNQEFPVVQGISEDDDAVLGNPNAPITIIEFSDYECPFCKMFVENTLPELKKNYIDTGKARLIYRDYPLTNHPQADDAAIAAECARDLGNDDTYFEFHDKLFSGALSSERYLAYASELGLDQTKFEACLDDPELTDEVYNDLRAGIQYGVTGTPTFFINGRTLSGAREYEVFEYLIERELDSN